MIEPVLVDIVVCDHCGDWYRPADKPKPLRWFHCRTCGVEFSERDGAGQGQICPRCALFASRDSTKEGCPGCGVGTLETIKAYVCEHPGCEDWFDDQDLKGYLDHVANGHPD